MLANIRQSDRRTPNFGLPISVSHGVRLLSLFGIAKISRLLAVAALSTTAANVIASGGATDIAAVSALRKVQPTVRWVKKSVVAADITCDGKPDQIVVGYGKDANVWVGFIPNGARPITMRFPGGKHSQDSVCSIPVRLETSPLVCSDEEMGDLPGCKEVKGCAAFSLIDDSCDSFHFYWNVSRKELVWWRR